MSTRFGGIWPAVLTPLTETGEPNLPQVDRLVELFIQQGLGGLYICGSSGQWPLLDGTARRRIVERVVAAAGGRIPVMVHVGAATTDEAVAHAQHAAQIGADAVSSVAPIYYPAGPDVVFEHYRRIGAATPLPLYVYHHQAVNTLALDAEAYVDRLLALPHIAGMKVTDQNMYLFGQIHACAGDRLQLFSGADELFCHAALSGAMGAIGLFYNVWGPACQQVRAAFVNGSFELGRRFMLTFQRVIADVFRAQSVWTFLRAAMYLKYDIDVGMPRAPLGAADRPCHDAEVKCWLDLVDQQAGVVP
jgi:N-acetylneuraminate lyase